MRWWSDFWRQGGRELQFAIGILSMNFSLLVTFGCEAIMTR